MADTTEKLAKEIIKSYILPGKRIVRRRLNLLTFVYILLLAWIIYNLFNVDGGPTMIDYAAAVIWAGAFFLLFYKPYLSIYINAAKSLRTLSRRGLILQAAAELETDMYDELGQQKQARVCTEHFFFGHNTGTALSYDDIKKIYHIVYRFLDGKRTGMLFASTDKRRKIVLVWTGTDETMDTYAESYYEFFKKKSPTVEIGKTKRKFSFHTLRGVRDNPYWKKLRNSK